MKLYRKVITLLMLLVLAPTMGFAGILRVCIVEGGDQRVEVVHMGSHDHLHVHAHAGSDATAQSTAKPDALAHPNHEQFEASPCQDESLFAGVMRLQSAAEKDVAPEGKVSPILSAEACVPKASRDTHRETTSEWRDFSARPLFSPVETLSTVILII